MIRGCASCVTALLIGNPKSVSWPNLWTLYVVSRRPFTPSLTNLVCPSANLLVGRYTVWKSISSATLCVLAAPDGFASKYSGFSLK